MTIYMDNGGMQDKGQSGNIYRDYCFQIEAKPKDLNAFKKKC